MKRLLFLLPLLCLVAHADEIPDWKVTQGKWSYDAKKKEIKGDGNGNLESTTFPGGDFTMDFQICIDDYTDAHNMVGISFRVATRSRYKLSFRRPNQVMFDKSWVDGEKHTTKSLASQSLPIPKGKWIPVKLSVRGGKMQARIGRKITLQAMNPFPPASCN
ncbi:MAG: hypothetical protein GXP25_15120 [Planctomycetes bacterium]|nr:hypothetical protein [Planctomycetota bacterium]